MLLINQTPFIAEAYVAADKTTREHWCVIAKGTLEFDRDGNWRPSAVQVPLIFADEHYGDPAETGVRYECDFVLQKPRVDVIVNGCAYAPRQAPVEYVDVALRVADREKVLRVWGERVWEVSPISLTGFSPSKPEPFLKRPILFTGAFGGSDHSNRISAMNDTEKRNPIGIGFHVNGSAKTIEGSTLPNVEYPNQLLKRWNQRPEPAGFGFIGRGWQPRIRYAGTYDQSWIDNRFPFLPKDFDTHYFQGSPQDQQFEESLNAATVICKNLTPNGHWQFTLPSRNPAAIFCHRDGIEEQELRLDTVVIEPEMERIIVSWRGSFPILSKIHDLRQIYVGRVTPTRRRALRAGKYLFKSLNEYMAWRAFNEISSYV